MRIVYLATADARGHLMRAQLLTHALRGNGVTVDVLTTSDDGVRFLAAFGITATLLSRHYAVQFDDKQNMLREATDANVANYVFRPSRLLRDVWYLRTVIRDADLMINDSFHPALLVMGSLPGWRRKIVHVYGASLRHALETNFQGRLSNWLAGLFRRVIVLQLALSRARLEHDFSYAVSADAVRGNYRLPTPVAIVQKNLDVKQTAQAAVYLNPHFSDPLLAESLEQGLDEAGMQAHLVGEGYAGKSSWLAQDQNWVEQAAVSDLIISAPGMAALSVALVYRRPIILVLTEQPEQQMNANRAAQLGLCHRVVVWRGDVVAFRDAVCNACRELLVEAVDEPSEADGAKAAIVRLQSWIDAITVLAALAQRH